MARRIGSLGSGLGTLAAGTAAAPKRADPELLTAAHREWRLAVLKRAGWRCEWIETDGTRCTKRAPKDRLVADHVVERKDGGARAGDGQCLCVAHNTLKGVKARAARHAQQLKG